MVVADLNRLWIVLKYSKRVMGMSNNPTIKEDALLLNTTAQWKQRGPYLLYPAIRWLRKGDCHSILDNLSQIHNRR